VVVAIAANFVAHAVEEKGAILERLERLEEVGVERVMLQYLPHRDLDGVDYIAELAE